MVVVAFPLAKLGLVLIKQLSKPIANVIKNEAKKHPTVRKYVIIPTGRACNNTLIAMKGKAPEKMSDEEIIEMGANAIGEILIFSILCAVVFAECNRIGDKKAAIQKQKDEEALNLVNTVLDMLSDIESLKESVEKLKADMERTLDVFEFEEQMHVPVYDDDFMGLTVTQQRKSKNMVYDDSVQS